VLGAGVDRAALSPVGAIARGTHPLSPPTLSRSSQPWGQESARFRPYSFSLPGLLFFGLGTLTFSRGCSLCLGVCVLSTALSFLPAPPYLHFCPASLFPFFPACGLLSSLSLQPPSLAHFARESLVYPPPQKKIRSTRLGVGGDVGAESWFP
jgi:hypothetical protein